MMLDLVIENAKILKNNNFISVNIGIENGKIAKLSKTKIKASESIDAKGYFVIPGVVDVHVHFREPGYEYKEDFYTGSKAAIAGGVTCVVDMPNNLPAINTPSRLKRKIEKISRKALVDFVLAFGLCNSSLKYVKDEELKIFKLYMSNEISDLKFNYENFENLKNFGKFIMIHAEHENFIDRQARDAEEYAIKNYDAEVKAIRLLLDKLNTFHICHISSKKAIEEIRKVKKSKKISVEVTPHHLFLTYKHYKELEALMKCNPPIKAEEDRKTLIDALNEGVINIIASDHAPHALEEKESFESALPGIANIEAMLSMVLTYAFSGVLDLSKALNALTKNPAELLNIKKGRISKGYDADLVFIKKERYKIGDDCVFSKCAWNIFENREVKAKVEKVFIRGELVFEEGEFYAKKGFGNLISNYA